MIRISVMYPVAAGNKFDMDYYLQKHMPMVQARLSAKGMVRAEVDKGLAGATPGSPAPFPVVGHLYFNSVNEFQAAFGAHAGEIMGDIPNYTNISPTIQVSSVRI